MTRKTDPYRYGWRYVNRRLPNGKIEVDQIPLTLEDVLHPQEDDVIPENYLHEKERGDLTRVFRSRLSRLTEGRILPDCIINWGVRGVKNHSPDISVFADLVRQPSLGMGTFHVARYKGRCLFLLELVSPHTRTNDVDRKLVEYHRVRVPLYIVVDQEEEDGPRQLLCYRYAPAGYRKARLDKNGRIFLKALGLHLGLENNLVVCHDAVTGEKFGDYAEVREEREAAKGQAREQAQARQAAEAAAREQAQARQAAEAAAREQAQARQAAEARVQELEAELRRLRGQA